MKNLRYTLFAVFLLVFAGCIEEYNEFYINPDGSGKVIHEAYFPLISLDMNDNRSTNHETELKKAIKDTLEKSEGIDVWSGIYYELTSEGDVHFKGVAYFPNLNMLNIKDGGISSNMHLNYSKNEAGQIIIEWQAEGHNKMVLSAKPDTAQLTDAQLNEQIKQAEFKYNKSKPMMEELLENLKSNIILHLPADINKLSNFTKIDDRTIEATIDGKELIEVMSKLMDDEKWLKEQIQAGKNPPQDDFSNDPDFREALFGSSGPIQVILDRNTEKLFNYKIEVDGAKVKFEKMLKELELEAESVIAPYNIPEEFSEPGKITIGKVQLTRYQDEKRGIYWQKGYTLTLILELPELADRITGGQLNSVVTNTGQSLLPQKEWDRIIHFPKLTEDRKAIVFDIKLPLPPEDVNGFKEISGTLEYTTAGGTKNIDLGITDFKQGARGTKLGAVITSIKKDSWNDKIEILTISVDEVPSSIESAIFYDQNSTKLDVHQTGWETLNDKSNIYYSIEGEFPAKGGITLKIFQDVKNHKISFELRDISLLGRKG